jgi:membrane protein implicated in regulation of membrane protease activity
LAWSLLLTEPFAIGKTGGQLKINSFVYVIYQLGGTKLVMVAFILFALFFFYLGYTYLRKIGNTQK